MTTRTILTIAPKADGAHTKLFVKTDDQDIHISISDDFAFNCMWLNKEEITELYAALGKFLGK